MLPWSDSFDFTLWYREGQRHVLFFYFKSSIKCKAGSSSGHLRLIKMRKEIWACVCMSKWHYQILNAIRLILRRGTEEAERPRWNRAAVKQSVCQEIAKKCQSKCYGLECRWGQLSPLQGANLEKPKNISSVPAPLSKSSHFIKRLLIYASPISYRIFVGFRRKISSRKSSHILWLVDGLLDNEKLTSSLLCLRS